MEYFLLLSMQVINAEFFRDGPPNVWGQISEGRDEILLFGKSRKFGVIFQKSLSQIIKD